MMRNTGPPSCPISGNDRASSAAGTSEMIFNISYLLDRCSMASVRPYCWTASARIPASTGDEV